MPHAPATVGEGRFVLRLRKVLAYRRGAELYLEGHASDIPARSVQPWDTLDGLDLRVSFADGRAAGLNDSAGIKTGRGPVLSLSRSVSWRGSGGTLHDVDVELRLWIWPLPPSGPVEVTCAWPELDVKPASFNLDGDALRHAAGDPPEDWPVDPAEPARATPEQTTVPDLVNLEVPRARAVARDAFLFLEHPDPDGPPLTSGRIIRQDPPAGTVVPSLTRVVAWATGEAEGPPPLIDPGPGGSDPGGPGGGGPPPAGDREPRRPSPLSGAGRTADNEPTSNT